jgi:hypothetical protein
MTSARSAPLEPGPDLPDTFRPLPSRQPPLAGRSRLLLLTRCLRAPLSPSKRSTCPVSVPPDSWLYPGVPPSAHVLAAPPVFALHTLLGCDTASAVQLTLRAD